MENKKRYKKASKGMQEEDPGAVLERVFSSGKSSAPEAEVRTILSALARKPLIEDLLAAIVLIPASIARSAFAMCLEILNQNQNKDKEIDGRRN